MARSGITRDLLACHPGGTVPASFNPDNLVYGVNFGKKGCTAVHKQLLDYILTLVAPSLSDHLLSNLRNHVLA
jgi:hypothetical protein